MYEDPLEPFDDDDDDVNNGGGGSGAAAELLEMPSVRILIFSGPCTIGGCADDELGTLSVPLSRSLGILIFRPVLCGDIFLSDEPGPPLTVGDASVPRFSLSLGIVIFIGAAAGVSSLFSLPFFSRCFSLTLSLCLCLCFSLLFSLSLCLCFSFFFFFSLLWCSERFSSVGGAVVIVEAAGAGNSTILLLLGSVIDTLSESTLISTVEAIGAMKLSLAIDKH